MADTRDIQSVVEAAEQAARGGDYASAERLLTEVAGLQEASLGPLHPDLANTLNNLAIVCEITEKPADAERHFRRAYAIATAALPPDHPFVATSRKNLEDFCNTRGIAVDEPPAPPPVVADPVVPPSPTVAIQHDRPPRPAAPTPVAIAADEVPAVQPPTARDARTLRSHAHRRVDCRRAPGNAAGDRPLARRIGPGRRAWSHRTGTTRAGRRGTEDRGHGSDDALHNGVRSASRRSGTSRATANAKAPAGQNGALEAASGRRRTTL